MPKMKTLSSAKKRFKLTGRGKVKANAAFRRHMMENKTQKMKRKARGGFVMAEGDERVVKRTMLPYGKKFA